jgi:hypothetical protein
MRWKVHGKDAVTGQRVVLAVEEAEATHAVQSALAKRILVTHVTRDRLRRVIFPMVCAAVTVLAPVSLMLYGVNRSVREEARAAVRQQAALAGSLREAEGLIASMKASGGTDVSARAVSVSPAAIREAQSQVAALQRNLSATQEELAAARAQVISEQHVSHSVEAARAPAQDAGGAAKVAELQRTNGELAGQVEMLKSQLLVAAAKADVPAAPVVQAAAEDAEAAPVVQGRWALHTTFAAAADFLNIHFDKESVRYTPAAGGDVLATGMLVANAASLQVVVDHDKSRVYRAVLAVSMAADAPGKKIEENTELIAAFLRNFAPTMRDSEAWIQQTCEQLRAKDAGQRLVRVGDEFKITAWNNGMGMYSWRVESPGNDLAE